MSKVVLFIFVGVCALLVEMVVPISRKTLFFTDRVKTSMCMVVTFVQCSSLSSFLIYWFPKGAKLCSSQKLEACGPSHDVLLFSRSSVSHQVLAVNQRKGLGYSWQRNPCQSQIES